MIKKQFPVAMVNVQEILRDTKTENPELEKFLDKFINVKKEKVKELKKELEDLKIMKMRGDEIVKIIDYLPEDAQDLNKIFIETSLDEDEQNKILDVIKKYR
jgi:DNA-directed RNA polymerase subunit F